jgi:TPR repeat protein
VHLARAESRIAPAYLKLQFPAYLKLFAERKGRFDRARKHFIIAANLGYGNSLKAIKDLYEIGHASKEDYASALRSYQAAVEATKSSQRKEAEAYFSTR